MSEEPLKQDIVRELDRLSPGKLHEVRDFIMSLRQRQSVSSLFEEIDESIQAVSEDDWEKVPVDASKRLDKYLYGSVDA